MQLIIQCDPTADTLALKAITHPCGNTAEITQSDNVFLLNQKESIRNIIINFFLFNYANVSLMIGYDSGLEISINRETWHKQRENRLISLRCKM